MLYGRAVFQLTHGSSGTYEIRRLAIFMSLVDRPPVSRQTLEQLLAQRILVLDGAMGTMVHALKFGEADFRGSRFADHPKDLRNLIDVLSITQPESIENIHRAYLEAGADIIETNTFGATS